MRKAFFLPFAALLAASCVEAPKGMYVEDATVRLPAVSDRPGAAYLTLTGGPVEERLMSITSPLAVRAEMHDMTMNGGVMKMSEINGGLAVPAGARIEFKSGGKHVMLFDISPNVRPGSKLPLTLTFASGATLSTEAVAEAPGGG